MANTKITSRVIADNSVGIDALNVTDGTNGQYLQTDGAGTLSFSTVSGYTDSDVATYLGGGNTINIDTQGTIKLDGNYPTGSGNVALGNSALDDGSLSGGNNTAIGSSALTAITSGTANTGVGESILFTETTGSNNTGVGKDAMALQNGADNNSAFGFRALNVTTTGSNNTAVGKDALFANTTGATNTAIGAFALSSSVGGYFQTAIGYEALKNTNYTPNLFAYSTAVGYQAGVANTTGKITAVGAKVLASNTTGINNAGFGGETDTFGAALQDNTTGSNNSAFGYNALHANTTASNNTAVGYNALTANTIGANNVAVGKSALDSNASGDQNTAVGLNAGQAVTTSSAGVFIGGGAGAQITTGNYNICVGYNAGDSGTTMHTNICIGKSAGNNITSGDRNIILGESVNPAGGTDYRSININTQGASGKGSGTGFLSAGAASGMYQGNNTTTWATTSDRRIKKNIVDNTDGLNKINNIQVKNFEYRTKEEIEELGEECAIEKEGVQLGVIAQELQTILPDCVTQESTGCFTVNADNITWYLVNAVKELSAQVEELKSRLGD